MWRSLPAQPVDYLMFDAGPPAKSQINARREKDVTAAVNPAQLQSRRGVSHGSAQGVRRDDRVMQAGDDQRRDGQLINDWRYAGAQVVISGARETEARDHGQLITLEGRAGALDH